MRYETYYKRYLELIEKGLDQVLPLPTQYPALIHEAMRYAVMSGGKRFRPLLVLAACEACGGKPEDAIVPATSIELIHSYSLVHDDLPALDNDDLRRGKPTLHKRYSEAVAILAGDGLLTLALQVLERVKPAEKACKLLREISTSAGTYGMIGGQIADLVSSKGELDLPMLDFISTHKTGKLIKASAVCGAIAAGASEERLRRMVHFGEYLGLAFQFVDDLIDGDGFLRLIKPREIRQKVRDLIAKAKREIKSVGAKAERLQALTDFLLRRIPKQTHDAVAREN